MTNTREAYKVVANQGSNISNISGAGWHDKGSRVVLTATMSSTQGASTWTYSADGNTRWHTTYTGATWNSSAGSVSNTGSTDSRAGSSTFTIASLSGPMTVTATGVTGKSQEQYNVIAKAGTNVGSVSGGGWYNKGATVTLVADTPKSAQGNYIYSPSSASTSPTEGATRYYNVTTYKTPAWSRTNGVGSVSNTSTQSTASAGAKSKLIITNLSSSITATASATYSTTQAGNQTYKGLYTTGSLYNYVSYGDNRSGAQCAGGALFEVDHHYYTTDGTYIYFYCHNQASPYWTTNSVQMYLQYSDSAGRTNDIVFLANHANWNSYGFTILDPNPESKTGRGDSIYARVTIPRQNTWCYAAPAWR